MQLIHGRNVVIAYSPCHTLLGLAAPAATAAAVAAAGGTVEFKLKGPKSGKSPTVWHCALYGTTLTPKNTAQPELDGFVNRQDRWRPYLNSRTTVKAPECPATLTPKGKPGPASYPCWEWKRVPK